MGTDRSALAILMVANLALLGLMALHLQGLRARLLREGEVRTSDLALVLEQALVGRLGQVDLLLQQVAEEFHQARKRGGTHAEALDDFLARNLARLPLLEGLRITDGEGWARHGTGVHRDAPLRVMDRPYYQALRSAADEGLRVSEPVKSQYTGRWVVMFSRRLSGEDGRFLGGVHGAVDLERLTEVLGKVDLGPGGSVSLRGPDRALWSRFPQRPDLEPGGTHLAGRYLEVVSTGSPAGRFDERSHLDGTLRHYHYRRLSSPTAHLQVGMGHPAILAPWRRELAKVGLLTGAFVLLSLVAGRQALRFAQAQALAHRRTAREEARYRLLTEGTQEVIWTVNLDGVLTYVSPAVGRQRGFTPAECLEGGVTRFQDALDLGGDPETERLRELVVQRKDGTRFPAEVLLGPLRDDAGQRVGTRGVTRDITARKQVETERDGLIEDLMRTLAEVRTLKGLLPICSHCKKVRDDQGYWNQIESYVSEHSRAVFSHGICPDCARTFFPGGRDREG